MASFSFSHRAARLLFTVATLGVFSVALTPAVHAAPAVSAAAATDTTARLINISTRAATGPGDSALIAGFVITGSTPKTVLVRGIGPSLALFGLTGLLPDPKITLHDSAGRVVAANDDYDNNVTPAGRVPGVGAFAFIGPKDAALVATLPPGNYTVVVADTAGRSGTALVEVYEADNANVRIGNLSSRAFVGSGSANVVIGGFAVQGDRPRRFLIRAVGPTLANFGVSGVLTDPIILLTTAEGLLVASNDDWASVGNLAEVITTANTVGAFTLVPGSKDAGLLVTLNPGNYTVILGGTANTSGVALLEVYEAP